MRRARTGRVRCAKRLAVLLALPVCAACGGGDPCGMRAMADTTGWRVVDAGPFVFKLPPGYRDEFALGTDSYAGLWTQGERSITFSWGPHTADPRLPPRESAAAPACEARIGGRTALVSEGRDRALGGGQRYRVGGWWEKPDTLGANLYLSGTGPADDEAGRTLATTVIRTVRLRTVWSAEDSVRMHHASARSAACTMRCTGPSIRTRPPPYLPRRIRDTAPLVRHHRRLTTRACGERADTLPKPRA